MRIRSIYSINTPNLYFNLPAVLPNTFIKQVNQISFKFTWDSKWEKNGQSQPRCDIDKGKLK